MEIKSNANEVEVQNSKTSQKQNTIEYVESPEKKINSSLTKGEIYQYATKKMY